MRKALVALGILILGMPALALDLVGVGGAIVPGLTFADEPIFSFIPQLVLGWDLGAMVTVGLGYETIAYDEGPWAYELDIKAQCAVDFDLVDVWIFKGFVAPVFSVTTAFKTAEGGQLELSLVPNWGLRFGLHSMWANSIYGSLYLDIQPELGIVPGFIIGAWIR